MYMESVPINYLAVVVSAVVMFALGGLWYGPLFGKPWMESMGWSPEKLKEMQAGGQKGMALNYCLQAIGSLLMAFVLAHALYFASTAMHVSGVPAGLMAGFWNWLGFIVPVTVGVVLWDGKPWKLWFINAGYYLVGLLCMGAILAIWTP